MQNFTLESGEQGLTLHLTPDSLQLEADPENQDAAKLHLSAGPHTLVLALSPEFLQLLFLQALALRPALDPKTTVPDLSAAWQLLGNVLHQLDDREMQILLRECSSDTLINCLWFMKSEALLQQVMRNMSQRAADMLMDDLERHWSHLRPDHAPVRYQQRGQNSLLSVLHTLRLLIHQGEIEEIPGFETACNSPDYLTQEEVDALLKGVTDPEATNV